MMIRNTITYTFYLLKFLRLNPYDSTNCIRFEGIISAPTRSTLLMFDGAKVHIFCLFHEKTSIKNDIFLDN